MWGNKEKKYLQPLLINDYTYEERTAYITYRNLEGVKYQIEQLRRGDVNE